MPPAAGSFVLDLLSTLKRGSMPVRALLEAAEPLGIAPGSVRVALARLLAGGQVARDARGRYRLGAAAAPLAQHVGAWRHAEARLRPWTPGRWLAVQTGAAAAPSARGERARRLLGLRAFVPGLSLRPDNLRGGVGALRAELAALGPDPQVLVFELSGLDPASEARARGLWDAAALGAGYARSLEELAASTRRLPGLPEAEARAESFLLGGRVIRQLALDPLLPEAIAPSARRRALFDAARAYDRLGRSVWARLLDRHGVPHLRTPVDLQSVGPALRLTAAAGAP
jgi:phenylacetic acid degradation operon negative regulatory protein